MRVIELGTVGSTSDEVAARVERGDPPPLAVRALVQTAGRGRRAREWESPPGGVWLSVALSWDGIVPGALAIHAALAVWDAIAPELRGDLTRLTIKWPNDVLLDGKKIAGVLCEGQSCGDRPACVVIGVGVNADFLEAELSDALKPRASTLRSLLGRRVDADALSHRLVDGIDALTPPEHSLLDADSLAEINERMAFRGDRVRFARPDGAEIHGILNAIDEHGRAVIRVGGDSVVVSSGDIYRAAAGRPETD